MLPLVPSHHRHQGKTGADVEWEIQVDFAPLLDLSGLIDGGVACV
jgi:hypothetical protein